MPLLLMSWNILISLRLRRQENHFYLPQRRNGLEKQLELTKGINGSKAGIENLRPNNQYLFKGIFCLGFVAKDRAWCPFLPTPYNDACHSCAGYTWLLSSSTLLPCTAERTLLLVYNFLKTPYKLEHYH